MSTGPSPRLSPLSTLNANQVIERLSQFVHETGSTVDILIVGALALHAYGVSDRATCDIDAELTGPLTPLQEFLFRHQIPSDLTQNFSCWSVVAMPPGYRDRANVLIDRPGLCVRVLAPLDFVIAKLRRGTELDLDDAELVARHYHLTTVDIQSAAQRALAASPQDSTLFLFQRTVSNFCETLSSGTPKQ